MEGVFNYSKYVTGKNYIGRSPETRALTNLLKSGENVVVYSGPKTGKMSLIQQALMNLRSVETNFNIATCSLMNVRNSEEFICRLGSEILRPFGSTQGDYSSLVSKFLAGGTFVFDPLLYSNKGVIVSLRNKLEDGDIESVFSLPYRVAQAFGKRIFTLLLEFQNIMLFEDGEKCLKIQEKVLKNISEEEKLCASYIFSGSMINAMHSIFGIKKYFYRRVERVELKTIETRDIIDHVQRNLLMGGKVIDKEMLLGVCTLFQNNIFHINHFFSICDSYTRGYITEPTLHSALESILSIYEGQYKAIMNDLTNFQVRLLKAILDGHIHLTNADVIDDYGLNSSANVRRLKDALCKKEIIYFNDKNEPKLIDSLFEYWVRRYFFEMKEL